MRYATPDDAFSIPMRTISRLPLSTYRRMILLASLNDPSRALSAPNER